MQSRVQLFALSLVPGIGPAKILRMLEHFGSVENIFQADIKERSFINGITSVLALELSNNKYIDLATKALDRADKLCLSIIIWGDKDYPDSLKSLYDPPIALWVRGDICRISSRRISIVGMRAASEYGTYAADYIASALARSGVAIISGGARGIDTIAHRAAIKADGQTVAVLGTGADIIYPPENAALFRSISETGAIITEFAPGTQPLPGHFPRRNRIISGLSYGTIVVEAGEKSGALITAYMALDQGREVFAVPGDIRSAKSRGTHRLIQQGAKLIHSVEDILAELPGMANNGAEQKEMQFEPGNLTASEQIVWNQLSKSPIHIDKLASQCEKSTSEVMAILLSMELKNWIAQQPGMLFKRIL
ncbi:DNA-processing protein DprA [bacterium]|nr:DNA-processing protein DprA [bacterium]